MNIAGTFMRLFVTRAVHTNIKEVKSTYENDKRKKSRFLWAKLRLGDLRSELVDDLRQSHLRLCHLLLHHQAQS